MPPASNGGEAQIKGHVPRSPLLRSVMYGRACRGRLGWVEMCLEGYKAVCSWVHGRVCRVVLGRWEEASGCLTGEDGAKERLPMDTTTPLRLLQSVVSLTCSTCLTGNEAASCQRWSPFMFTLLLLLVHVCLAMRGPQASCRGPLYVHKQSAHPTVNLSSRAKLPWKSIDTSVCREPASPVL